MFIYIYICICIAAWSVTAVNNFPCHTDAMDGHGCTLCRNMPQREMEGMGHLCSDWNNSDSFQKREKQKSDESLYLSKGCYAPLRFGWGIESSLQCKMLINRNHAKCKMLINHSSSQLPQICHCCFAALSVISNILFKNQFSMGLGGLRFQILVATSYLTLINARQKDFRCLEPPKPSLIFLVVRKIFTEYYSGLFVRVYRVWKYVFRSKSFESKVCHHLPH